MFGLLTSVVDLAADVVTVVATPVKMALDLADAAVKPIANAAESLAKDVKSLKD